MAETEREARDKRVDVVVVGAGMSGLAAADALLAQGRSVLVLEAQDKPGGRITTHPMGEGVVHEFGPSYIGPAERHMHRLVRRFGLDLDPVFFPKPGRSIFLFSKLMGFDIALQAQERGFDLGPFEEAITDLDRLTMGMLRGELSPRQFAKFPRSSDRPEFPQDPWATLDADRMDDISVADWTDAYITMSSYGPNYALTKELLFVFVRAILSVEPEEISMLFFLYYVARCGGMRAMVGSFDYGPDSNRVVQGYQSVADQLAGAIQKHGLGEVRYGRAVSRIDVAKADVRVTHGEGRAKETVRAEHVVVAIPPHLVADIRIDALAADGQGRRQALSRRMKPGRTIKGYVNYRTPWWRERRLVPSMLLRMPGLRLTRGAAEAAVNLLNPRLLVAAGIALAADALRPQPVGFWFGRPGRSSLPPDELLAPDKAWPRWKGFWLSYTGHAFAAGDPLLWVEDATFHRDALKPTASRPVDYDGHLGTEPKRPALQWWIVGAAADEWDRKTPIQRREMVLRGIGRRFGFLGKHPDGQLADEPWFSEHSWQKDEPWIGGGPTGVPELGVFRELGPMLRRSVAHVSKSGVASLPRLHWAGTEVARRFGGYMEGAVDAGLEAARKVAFYSAYEARVGSKRPSAEETRWLDVGAG